MGPSIPEDFESWEVTLKLAVSISHPDNIQIMKNAFSVAAIIIFDYTIRRNEIGGSQAFSLSQYEKS
jgi:hypothetical protein